MKKKLILVAALILSFMGIMAVNASPGDANDPLVSKSYVDSRINEVLSIVGAQESDIITEDHIRSIIADIMANVVPEVQEQEEEKINFVPVNVTQGRTVLGHEGSEIILRSGTGIAYVIGENGLVNMTKGTEIFNAGQIDANNLIIVPREGRGVIVTSEEAWFMIRGGYDISN